MRRNGVRLAAISAAFVVAVSISAGVGAPGASSQEAGSGKKRIEVAVSPKPAVQGSIVIRGQGASDPPSEELKYDLRHYANEEGLEYENVLDAHRGIGEFSELVTDLEARFPDDYVRSGLSGADDAGDFWIQVTAKPGQRLLDRLRSLPVDVEVEYGAPASSRELAALTAALTKATAERSDVIQSSSTAYNPETHVVTLEYTPRPGVTATDTADEVARSSIVHAAGTFEGDLLPVDVVLDRQAAATPSVLEARVQGGRTLRLRASNRRECTAGFTARRNGRRGVLTARHCRNRLRYVRKRNVLARARQTSYRAVDVQWHRTLRRHRTNKQFRATGYKASDDRIVRAVRNAPRRSTVCHWGFGTGYDCSSVTRTDQCLTVGGRRKCGVDFTRDDVSAGGDSGGPWFLGTTARGIHLGARPGNRSYFTRISRVYQHLGAKVLQR